MNDGVHGGLITYRLYALMIAGIVGLGLMLYFHEPLIGIASVEGEVDKSKMVGLVLNAVKVTLIPVIGILIYNLYSYTRKRGLDKSE